MRRFLLPVVFLLGACYRYTAVPGMTAAPGGHVRLGLLPTTDGRLAAILGAETTAIEGRVLRESDTAWEVSVAATLKRREPTPANRTIWAGEPVTIPRVAVNRVELRSLDRKKTTRAAVLGSIGAVVLVRLIVFSIDAINGGDDGGIIITPP